MVKNYLIFAASFSEFNLLINNLSAKAMAISAALIMEDIAYDLKYEEEVKNLRTWLHQSIMELSKDDSCLTKWIRDEQNAKLYTEILKKLATTKHLDNNIISTKSRYPYCCIIVDKKFDKIEMKEKTSYTTDYRLILHHRNELYYIIFTAPFSRIESLHKIAVNDRIYFPSTKATRYALPECM